MGSLGMCALNLSRHGSARTGEGRSQHPQPRVSPRPAFVLLGGRWTGRPTHAIRVSNSTLAGSTAAVRARCFCSYIAASARASSASIGHGASGV